MPSALTPDPMCVRLTLRSVPVLVAIDEINGMLEGATATHGFDHKILAPSQLSLISHFLAFVDGRKALVWFRCVVVHSDKHAAPRSRRCCNIEVCLLKCSHRIYINGVSGQGVLPTRSVQPGTDKFLSLAASPSAAAKAPFAYLTACFLFNALGMHSSSCTSPPSTRPRCPRCCRTTRRQAGCRRVRMPRAFCPWSLCRRLRPEVPQWPQVAERQRTPDHRPHRQGCLTKFDHVL